MSEILSGKRPSGSCYTNNDNPPSRRFILDNWKYFKEGLAEQCHGIISNWISSGAIFSHVRRATKISLARSNGLSVDPEAASTLSGTTIAVSLNRFQHSLEADCGWRPTGGASLRTFFFGQCLRCFPNEYNRWLREHRRNGPAHRHDTLQNIESSDIWPDPFEVTSVHMEVTRILHESSERTRLALVYTAAGYSQKEIAGIMKSSPKAIEMLLKRCRERHRSHT